MDTLSLIYGGAAGLVVLLLLLVSLTVFASGIHRRSWGTALAGFLMCYTICILMDIVVYKTARTPVATSNRDAFSHDQNLGAVAPDRPPSS